jgi:hypothetical protein
MNNILQAKIFIPIVIIIFLIGLHYYINYRVRILLKSELRKISEKKHKKMKETTKRQNRSSDMQNMQEMQQSRQMDMDSYEDPAETYDNMDNMDMPKQQRLTKNNIGTRDFNDL